MVTNGPSDPDELPPAGAEGARPGDVDAGTGEQEPVAGPPSTPPTPTKYGTEIGQVPPVRPNDPITPFLRPPGPRPRRREWPVLIVALVVSGLVLAVCCIAGFALYASYGTQLN
jgi:hypothetical protein